MYVGISFAHGNDGAVTWLYMLALYERVADYLFHQRGWVSAYHYMKYVTTRFPWQLRCFIYTWKFFTFPHCIISPLWGNGNRILKSCALGAAKHKSSDIVLVFSFIALEGISASFSTVHVRRCCKQDKLVFTCLKIAQQLFIISIETWRNFHGYVVSVRRLSVRPCVCPIVTL